MRSWRRLRYPDGRDVRPSVGDSRGGATSSRTVRGPQQRKQNLLFRLLLCSFFGTLTHFHLLIYVFDLRGLFDLGRGTYFVGVFFSGGGTVFSRAMKRVLESAKAKAIKQSEKSPSKSEKDTHELLRTLVRQGSGSSSVCFLSSVTSRSQSLCVFHRFMRVLYCTRKTSTKFAQKGDPACFGA